jgi:hypothetical protein
VSLSTAVRTGRAPERPRLAVPPKLRLAECLTGDEAFGAMITQVARRWRVDERALKVRALLHLPRVAGYSGLMPARLVWSELSRLADQLAADFRTTADQVPRGVYELRQLTFAKVPPALAAPVIASRHYLRSARPGSDYYALLDPAERLPVSLCSVSPLQWRRVAGQIDKQFGISRDQVRDVSRVYSCDSAPPNAISYLLARLRAALKQTEPDVKLLTTAVDRNLGFSGSSYRAANWQHWITVQPRPYLYHNSVYVSPRQLREEFGTSALAELQESRPGERFEQSRVRLKESLIFGWRVHGETESAGRDAELAIHR